MEQSNVVWSQQHCNAVTKTCACFATPTLHKLTNHDLSDARNSAMIGTFSLKFKPNATI